MHLPQLAQSTLKVAPVHTDDLPRRFMNHGELDVLVTLARSVQPRVGLEIGVNIGRTARVLLREVPTFERYIGVDVMPGYVPVKPVQRDEVPRHNEAGYIAMSDPRFELILRPNGSFDVSTSELGTVDFVFIDGDHSYRAVTHDTFLAQQIVRPGGMIVWHDYHHKGTVDVAAVLERFASDGHEIMHVADTWLAFENVHGS